MSNSEFARNDIVTSGLADTSLAAKATVDVADVPAPPVTPRVRWNVLTRLGFRFTAAYLVMFCLFATQQIFYSMFGPILFQLFGPVLRFFKWNITPPHSWGPIQKMANHIAIKWWGFAEPSKGWHQGGGDKPFDWALVYGLLLIAAAVTVVWSAVDWKRPNYERLHAWLRLWIRVAVGTQMVSYGFAKAFPQQMPYPGLMTMMSPYGNLNLMGVLWSEIGSSPAYEIFTGCAEVLAAALLLIPGLTTIGALVGIAVTSQVWILNMTYDVPVKNLSMHLLIMCIVLLLPDAKRLGEILVLKRRTGLPAEPRLFKKPTVQRVAIGLQAVFAAYVLIWGSSGYLGAKASWAQNPANQPKPPLYGIWIVDKMMINGVERAPLISDYDRWRRIVFDRPYSVRFQRTNDSNLDMPALVDLEKKIIRFTNDVPNPFQRPGAAKPPVREFGQMTIQQPAPDKLVLDGTLTGRQIRVETTYWDPRNFRLRQAKFRWIQ